MLSNKHLNLETPSTCKNCGNDVLHELNPSLRDCKPREAVFFYA